MRTELMTLAALALDPWISVVMPLPETADRSLLDAARQAAACCAREVRTVQEASRRRSEDEVREMEYFEPLVAARIDEIDRRARAVGPHLG